MVQIRALVIQILCKYYANIVRILFEYCMNIVPILWTYHSNICPQMFHEGFHVSSPKEKELKQAGAELCQAQNC